MQGAGTLDPMSGPTLAECAQLLADVVDINQVLVDPRVVPALGSPAAAELEAACRQGGKAGFWGEEPVRLAYTVAVTNYGAALEHARAVARLMSGEFTAVPASVLVRALVEVASQAWWLLESGIGHVKPCPGASLSKCSGGRKGCSRRRIVSRRISHLHGDQGSG